MEIIYIKSSASHDLASFVSQSEVKIVNQYDKYSLKQISGVIIGMSLDLYELQKTQAWIWRVFTRWRQNVL